MTWEHRYLRVKYVLLILLLFFICFVYFFSSYEKKTVPDNSNLDRKLRDKIKKHSISSLQKPPPSRDSLVKLGGKLFFDQIMSGNRDIACSSCHHNTFAFSDRLSLSIGSGATGTGVSRQPNSFKEVFPRNALDLTNRALPQWDTMFWDMRIRKTGSGKIVMPDKIDKPDSIDTLLGAQMLLPLFNRNEMRGHRGDNGILGRNNKLALIPDDRPEKVFQAIVDRLMNHEVYKKLFKKAYPSIGLKNIGIEHVTHSIYAFQKDSLTFLNSPWDKYLEGDSDALSYKQKKGALIFFGKGNCTACHSGALFSDQEAHNIGVPQLGPGFSDKGYDYGRFRVTKNPSDRFAFRTPPLRNVELTGPWMHNGAYKTLSGALKHHFNPRKSLMNYDGSQLGRDIQKLIEPPIRPSELKQYPFSTFGVSLLKTVKTKRRIKKEILQTLDPKIERVPELKDDELELVIHFLQSLTSPTLRLRKLKYNAEESDEYSGPYSEDGDYVKEELINRLRIGRFPGLAGFAGNHLTTNQGVLDEKQAEALTLQEHH